MASSDPVGDALTLLYGVLSGDATFMAYVAGGIHQVMAPPGATTDYALLIHQSGRDTNTATATRVLSSLVFQVKIVGPAQDEANLRAAYKRADALLQPTGSALRNTDATLACFREQTIYMGELVNGALWLNIGGLYRVEV